MRRGCVNAACRYERGHSGPCDMRTEDQVALALPPEMLDGVRVLADGLAFARGMNEDRSPYQSAYAAVWVLRDHGWTVTPTSKEASK